MIAALCVLASPAVQAVDVKLDAPKLYLEGEPYVVSVEITAPTTSGAAIPVWWLTPAAFTIDGLPLQTREGDAMLQLLPGQEVSATMDLTPSFAVAVGFTEKDFKLGFADDAPALIKQITYLEAAEKGIDFTKLPVAQLSDYNTVLITNRGPIWIEFMPKIAPNHVRNFLDLSYTGFYDGTIFHRVIPGFMVQGGGGKSGDAPRRLKAEFNKTKHVAGIVSMARLPRDIEQDGKIVEAINSATTEFFIVHEVYPSLDGNYTAFGKLVDGLDVVELIVQSGNKSYEATDERAHKPPVDQVIEKALVVKARDRRTAEDGEPK